jgi:simple sugar transport system ATP-binding protein
MRPKATGEPVLELTGVSTVGDRGSRALHDVNLILRPGEILGVAGVSGNGQKELGEVVLGLRRSLAGGTVRVAGQDMTRAGTAGILAAGVACIPEDPIAMAIVPDMSVRDNLGIGAGAQGNEGPRDKGWLPMQLVTAWEKVASFAERFQLRMPPSGQPIGTLSGGNIQRLVLGREIVSAPKVLLAYYPTHGLDIGATRTIHAMLREACEAGSAVLFVSEDLEELTTVSDRLAVMFHGQVVGVFDRDAVDLSTIGLMMTGGHVEDSPKPERQPVAA